MSIEGSATWGDTLARVLSNVFTPFGMAREAKRFVYDIPQGWYLSLALTDQKVEAAITKFRTVVERREVISASYEVLLQELIQPLKAAIREIQRLARSEPNWVFRYGIIESWDELYVLSQRAMALVATTQSQAEATPNLVAYFREGLSDRLTKHSRKRLSIKELQAKPRGFWKRSEALWVSRHASSFFKEVTGGSPGDSPSRRASTLVRLSSPTASPRTPQARGALRAALTPLRVATAHSSQAPDTRTSSAGSPVSPLSRLFTSPAGSPNFLAINPYMDSPRIVKIIF